MLRSQWISGGPGRFPDSILDRVSACGRKRKRCYMSSPCQHRHFDQIIAELYRATTFPLHVHKGIPISFIDFFSSMKNFMAAALAWYLGDRQDFKRLRCQMNGIASHWDFLGRVFP
jgi:hypothetical protein